jgi:hypothetical protein
MKHPEIPLYAGVETPEDDSIGLSMMVDCTGDLLLSNTEKHWRISGYVSKVFLNALWSPWKPTVLRPRGEHG